MKILVTGGSGFIGSHLCEKLLGKQETVFNLDNFCDFYSPEIKRRNIEPVLENSNYKLLEGDICDEEYLDEIFSKHEFDMVIHLAAMAGVRPSIENPQLYTKVNINGTMNLLEKCRKYSVKKFIFASSSSVYGNNTKIPFSESDRVDFPVSPYAATKKAGELLCHSYYHLYGISVACLRFFTVIGPRQRPDLALHKFARKIVNNKPIQIYGDGTSKRDYTYIDDIIDGVLKAIEFVLLNKQYEIFNLGESKRIDLSHFIRTLEKELQKTAIKEWLPMQPGDVFLTYADISKSRKVLDYEPRYTFELGVKKFVEWFKKNSI
ncbi:MAG: GDP-mannose 4,6-dehydratase [Candidatus Cloacimonadota bacterium]|nr:GDP-mannose 4,6-dehydratase [Candidatus Cloacimonadota bacterium]